MSIYIRKEYKNMKSVRIGGGAGYAGDRIEPALDIINYGEVDYIIFECLAERSIALAQKEKLADPSRGYNHLLEYRMEKIMPLLIDHKVKIITNMGAANPVAAADKIYEIACKNGLQGLRVAALEGDDVFDKITKHYETPIMETGETLEKIKDSIVSANAYIGAQQISEALSNGADIVVTGRVADPSLVTGPIMYEFNKSYEDYDFLGKSIVAGHLLECGGQVTGGYYADPGYKDVPDLWNLGFPIITFSEEGDMELEKLPGTGGVLNTSTVKEQLLYEIQDPENYFTPDVVADFSKITVKQNGENRVIVKGAAGKTRTGTLKVSVGYLEGFIGEGEISYGGHNAVNRVCLAEEIIRKRLEMLDFKFQEIRFDLIGLNSLYSKASSQFNTTSTLDPQEVRLRVSARVESEEAASVIGKEVEALYTNGPAGGGGARGYVRKIVSVASILIPEEEMSSRIVWKGGNI